MFRKLFFAVLILAILWIGWEWITFPDVSKLRTGVPETTAFMELRKKQLRKAGQDDRIEYRWVPYGRISPNLRRAVLVAEDDAFYQHDGVDVEGLREAMRRNWESRSIRRGGSTITQQLAKNLYLSPSRNPWRKLKEYLIARELEKELSKKRILEIYLNVVEYGERWYGAEAAAQHYFDRSASSLSASQASLLAGCLPNPRVMNPSRPNKRLRYRQRMILSRMKRWGYLAEKEVLTEKKREEEEEPKATPTPEASPEPGITDTDLAPDTAEEEIPAPEATPQESAEPTADETIPSDPPATALPEQTGPNGDRS
jgi:monofunctional biosynthetic peptidoglycan transglycosylase